MTPKETALEFVKRINQHDVDGVVKLMTKDHRFMDSHGHVIQDPRQLKDGWRQYFEWFPDYEISVSEVFEDGTAVALFGAASGSFRNSRNHRWRIPAAWLAVIENRHVREWHVFADTKIPLSSMK